MITESQHKILNVLKREGIPQTVNDLAGKARVSGQTVRNNLPLLINSGKVQVARITTGSRGYAYELTDIGTGSTLAIRVNGDAVSLRELLQKAGEQEFSASLRPVIKTIILLFRAAIDSLDDDNPVPVSIRLTKDEQAKLVKLVQQFKSRIETIEDLLALDDIWDPTKLAKALVLNDASTTYDEFISMLDRVTA